MGKFCGDEARCLRPLPIPIPPAPPGIPTCEAPIDDGSPCDDGLSPCRAEALCRGGSVLSPATRSAADGRELKDAALARSAA